MSSKIVVVGDILGQFSDVFQKLGALHAKNSFSFALITGDLFNDPSQSSEDDYSALLEGSIQIPLPTYFALGKFPLPPAVIQKLEDNDGELCENLQFLGRRNTLKTSDGIRIVTLGGSLHSELDNTGSNEKYLPFYSAGDAKSLKGANTADILVTSDWPANIRRGSKVDFTGAESEIAHDGVAELCATLKPRYFFSTSRTAFYEREPFFFPPSNQDGNSNPKEEGYAITRFISLAPFGNSAKQKWIYAFTIDPSSAPPVVVPPGTTPCPFQLTMNKKRPLSSQNESYSRFMSSDQSDRGYRQSKKRRQKQPPPGPSECFFCLSNPNVATHLVASISDNAYLTTAKGPLTTSKTYERLGFPCHILIIPVPHTPTLTMISDPTDRHNTITEMTRFRDSLHKMLLDKADKELGAVCWEISRATGIHTHWQFLPVPVDLINRGLVDGAFKVEAENEKYPTFNINRDTTTEEDGDTGDYFKVWIWQPYGGDDKKEDGQNPGSIKTLTLAIDSSFRFDLQFGRRVMAKLLRLESRLNWRDCGQTEAEEAADAEAFKQSFEKYDFSLSE